MESFNTRFVIPSVGVETYRPTEVSSPVPAPFDRHVPQIGSIIILERGQRLTWEDRLFEKFWKGYMNCFSGDTIERLETFDGDIPFTFRPKRSDFSLREFIYVTNIVYDYNSNNVFIYLDNKKESKAHRLPHDNWN